MTTPNAIGFLFLGLLLLLLPPAAPAWFPPHHGLIVANTSALWLEFMGWVNHAIGAWFLADNELRPAVVRALAWAPPFREELAPGEILRPALVFDAGATFEAAPDRRAVA